MSSLRERDRYELEGRLLPPSSQVLDSLAEHMTPSESKMFQLGSFLIDSPSSQVTEWREGEEWTLHYLEKSDEGIRAVGEPILTLELKHRLSLIQITIDMISAQVNHYESAHFSYFISTIDSDVRPSAAERGGEMIRQTLDQVMQSYCARLSDTLKAGPNEFYNEYVMILAELNPDEVGNIRERIPNAKALVENAIGLTDYPASSWGSLVARWFTGIVTQLWYGDVKHDAIKSPVMGITVSKGLIRAQDRKVLMPLAPTSSYPWYAETERYAETEAVKVPESMIKPILNMKNQAVIIDIIRLLLFTYYETQTVRRNSNRLCIPGGYKGLTQLLAERFGTSTGRKQQTNVRKACNCLDMMRFINGDEKVGLFAIEHRNKQLLITYLSGATDPLEDHERLIPLIHYPKGRTKSRARYNKFAFAVCTLIADESDTYLKNECRGIPLTQEVITRLRIDIGAGRNSDVHDLINEWRSSGALISDPELLGLGQINEEANSVLSVGAQMKERGRRGGLKSAKKKAKGLK